MTGFHFIVGDVAGFHFIVGEVAGFHFIVGDVAGFPRELLKLNCLKT